MGMSAEIAIPKRITCTFVQNIPGECARISHILIDQIYVNLQKMYIFFMGVHQ